MLGLVCAAMLQLLAAASLCSRPWSSLDGVSLQPPRCPAEGWISDPNYSGPPLPVRVTLDGVVVATALANVSRQVAGPHGFLVPLGCAAFHEGFHTIRAFGPASASNDTWVELRGSPKCVQDGGKLPSCVPPPPSPPTPAPPPGQVCSFDMPAQQTADCADVEGRFTCTSGVWGVDGVVGQGLFGYCQKSPLANSTAGRCCRIPDPAHSDRPAAPPIASPAYPPPPAARPDPKAKPPNVVLFLTDDEDVQLGSLSAMNRTTALMREGGTTLRRHYVTTPICCPSRVSLLSGRYAHNAGAQSNLPSGWCGVGTYWKAPLQNLSLPTYVRRAGLATGIFGKELNVNDDTYISPGWDRFFVLGGTSEGRYYTDWFNDQGKRYNATAGEYMTELIANRSLAWMGEQLAKEQPFFAYIAPHAPHTRATPAPGTDGYFTERKAPRWPSWNLSAPDKHWMVAQQEPLTELCASASDELFRNRLRALLGVDRLVGQVADLLMAHDALNDTYLLYTADHGFHLGEFRMPFFKGQPYDSDINVPMMVRGPGIRAGAVLDQIGLNIDIAPTIAALVGTSPPAEAVVDGRSLAPLLFAPSDTAAAAVPWRDDFLFEFWAGPKTAFGAYCHHIMMSGNNTYAGVRTADDLKFVKFRDDVNFTEYYNISADVHEITNAAQHPDQGPTVVRLGNRLEQLRVCAGDSCR